MQRAAWFSWHEKWKVEHEHKIFVYEFTELWCIRYHLIFLRYIYFYTKLIKQEHDVHYCHLTGTGRGGLLYAPPVV